MHAGSPAGATAQPEESEPDLTGQAASPYVYISRGAHRAGERPEATHNTATRYTRFSKPVGHAAHRPVHAPAKEGHREDEAKPTQKKNNRGGGGETPPAYEQETAGTSNVGSPPRPTGTDPPIRRGGDGGNDSHGPVKPNEHPTKAGNPMDSETTGGTDGTHR